MRKRYLVTGALVLLTAGCAGRSPVGFLVGTLKGIVHARPWPPAAGSSSPPP